MEIVTNSYMPGDPRLVEQLVYELKSQGIFDQFRKECIADVDTKPAYQNLRQRVEGSVTSFLKQQTWRPDMNKNQVREQLRKNIYESGYLDTGVERIVDQVVNPKINTIFLPKVEDVVYRYLGIEKPNRLEVKKELKIDVTDLLPTDLEAISPESDHTKDDSLNFNDSLISETKMEEDESPPFEPIDVQSGGMQLDENSVDSHLSGFSGLQSHDSNPCTELKECPMELSNQDSQVSQNSSDSRLSIITSEDNTKMEVREDCESKLLRSSESNSLMENPVKTETTFESNPIIKDEVMKPIEETDSNSDNNMFDDKNVKKQEEEKDADMAKKKQIDEKQNEDKKYNERKSDEKKNRSSEKYSSKDKKEDKYRKSSGSSSREKEKSSSKYSSSSSSKDRSKTKDKKESRSSSSSGKDKDKVEKDKYDKDKPKNDKDKDRSEREKDKDKRDKYEKDKSEKSKTVKEKEKSTKDKDKGRSSSSNGNGTSNSKSSTNKEKDKSSSSSKSDSSKKDKEKSRLPSSSSSSSKDKSKSSHSDSKSKSSSSDKHKKDDKNAHVRHSSSSSSSKKDKDKKKDSKKDVKDDHYSSKDKKNDRRSTDRDSNDGRSGRQSQTNSFTESNSSQPQKSSQESSNSNSGSGSGDSGTSDQNEHVIKSPIKTVEPAENKELVNVCLDTQRFKYLKPKFASNFQEARKLMKIRKQLAKLERHNQLSLAQIEVPMETPMMNGTSCVEKISVNDKNVDVENIDEDRLEGPTGDVTEVKMPPKDDPVVLQSTELSKESWEALEARLAQEMSNINYNSYESPYDDYDYSGCNSTLTTSPKKLSLNTNEKSVKVENVEKIAEPDFSKPKGKLDKIVCIVLPQIDMKTKLEEQKETVMEKIVENPPCNAEASANEKTDDDKKCTEEGKETNTQQDFIEPTNTNELEDANKTETIENLEPDTEMNVDSDEKVENVENTHRSDSETMELCTYLEPLSPRLDKNLQFLYRYIEKLEQDVKHSLKTFQNNFVPLKEKYGKRKLVENVDLKNNNKAHYEQTTDLRKKRRSVAANLNSVISKADKEKLCNSSDISSNDNFSLPLSPAESDKSNEKKEEDSPKTKQKRETTGKGINARNQRYSSEDLYKPRPIFMSSRRSRGAKNVGK